MPEYLKAALREKISTFHQLPDELFWQTWQRFDRYRRERPHHGYSDFELLQFFYYGVREYFQVELDVAGFWDLCAEYIQGAYRLVDNMAFSSHDNPMAELEAQIYYLMEKANKREDVGFNTAENKDATSDQFLSQQPFHNQFEDAHSDTQTSTLSSPPEPVRTHEVSYPASFEKLQQGLEAAKCAEVMNISVKKPSIIDAIQPPPEVDEKVIRKCGSTLRNKLATRFGDSTRLEISVKFEKTTFANSYYDSGSNLNWMTYATARSLGFTFNHFKDTGLSLKFTDQSEILALGILKDLPVTIDNLHVRVGFAVLALGEEFDGTIILGEPFDWATRFVFGVQKEKSDFHMGDNTTTSQKETEKIDSELATVGAESAEEINLPPLPERFCTPNTDLGAVEHADTLEEDLVAAASKEATPVFAEEPSLVDAVQTTLVVQEEMPTSDEDTLQNPEVRVFEDAPRSELCVEPKDMPLAETEDISSTKNQTRHGFCAKDIIESATMPRSGPDKPKDHTVSQFDKIVHNDIEDSLANIWSMSKKGNGFPWDDGIELELVDDPKLDNMNLWVKNLLEPSLIVDQEKSRLLIRDARKTAGIPRSGPDIPSFHEFDQSQFLSFAGEGSRITYCDLIGSMTRPPETLLDIPVLC